jgi:penicillin amidase
MPRLRSRTRLVVWTMLSIVALVVLLAAVGLWEMHRSVPELDGQAHVPGLRGPVMISRDALGTAVVQGANRLDVARGLGFVHAQERFFEMDLARRSAAGELSELFGSVALEHDKKRRMHRMRAMLTARFAQMDEHDHALLLAYADGVNAGLSQLDAKPWQYMMLRAEPRAWSPVDSLLVIGEMYWMLQGNGLDDSLERAQWNGPDCTAPYWLARWMTPVGGAWDGALDGTILQRTPMPGPEVFDLREKAPIRPGKPVQEIVASADRSAGLFDDRRDDAHQPAIGSNNWAVDGAHSITGDALLANDMHLSLGVPSIWFRAQFEIGAGAIRAAGVTLPGVPALVVGSNGHVAWGFTNSYGAWFEWVKPGGTTTRIDETIHVKGAPDVVLPVTVFDGMPVIEEHGRYALNWVADQGGAYNLKLDDLLTATEVDTALRVAASAGIPEQNFLVADRHGRIAWTIAGPRFVEATGRQSFDSHDLAQDDEASIRPARQRAIRAGGGAASGSAPLIADPAGGVLWTANARAYRPTDFEVGADYPAAVPAPPPPLSTGHIELGVAIGDGGYDLGARARQIHQRLLATPKFDEKSLGAIHFDDEALFLKPWAARLAAVPASRPEVLALLKAWNGRADADQTAYRLIRETRSRTLDALWQAWSTPLIEAGQCPKRAYDWHSRFEYPAEDALDRKPAHLLPRGFATWDAFLLAQVDATVDDMTRHGARPLSEATWGERNASRIAHPLARALPLLSRWLDMPSLPQSGDANMPHVAAPSFGQSERLVVAPGHEERATLSMPGGQSGHPMSPYYGAGHADWVAGRATPLLAGPAQHVLTLTP